MTQQTSSAATAFASNPVGATMAALSELENFSTERPNLGMSFVRRALESRESIAIVDGENSITYIQLLGRAIGLAMALRTRLGDARHVGILLPPSPAGVTANLALTLLGKVPVNINYGTGNEIVNYTVADCKIEQVISSPTFLEQVKLELEVTVLDMANLAAATRDEALQHQLELKLIGLLMSGAESLIGDFAGLAQSLDDTATVLYTSGSTSKPKGTILSQRSILSNVQAIAQQYPERRDSRRNPIQEVILGSLTFAHSLGYTGTLWAALCLGYKAVYLPNPLDSRAVCKAVADHRVTIFITAPTLMRLYLLRAKKEQFASVEVLLLGSEKLRPELRRDIKEKLDKEACEAYGATEMGPIITLSVPRLLTAANGKAVWGSREGSVGLPVAGTDVAIVDTASGALVEGFGTDYQGEIWVRGSQIMDGYLGNPEASAKAIIQGWYRTGDIGYIDEDGFIYITDRLARFAKVSAEMVPMAFLEGLIREATGQDELSVHVTCVPDPGRGERLIVIYTSLGSLDPATVVGRLGDKLNPLWVPKAADFLAVEKLPVGPTGKLDMQSLKTLAKEHFVQ